MNGDVRENDRYYVVFRLAVRRGDSRLSRLPQRTNGDTAERTEEILVAATTLQIGALLRAKDVTWQQIGGDAGLGQIARPRTAAGSPNLELDQQDAPKCMGPRCVRASWLASRSVAAPL